MKHDQYQVLIIGAGITGLTIARELIKQGAESILILEKESSPGLHASGRNSGVLHAGMYYTPDSLKAKFCVKGNRMMKEFCRQKGLALKESGKVILAPTPAEFEALQDLKRRADACGARALLIDNKELHEIEPYAADCEQALFSPDTAVIRPIEVLTALAEEITKSRKATIWYNAVFTAPAGEHRVRTSHGVIHFEKFINAAGSYADRIAHQFGLAGEYRLLPFRGTYKKLISHRTHLVRGNIYPVPDLRTPFLGVHFTRIAEGEVLIGPTAMPAFGRENYRVFEKWGWETAEILARDLVLMFQNRSFLKVALTEPRKYLKRFVFKEAKKLVPNLELKDLMETEHVGIRPQLIHWPTRTLVMDYVVLRDVDSLHILNPISPAFTSSMAFAKDVVADFLGGARGMS